MVGGLIMPHLSRVRSQICVYVQYSACSASVRPYAELSLSRICIYNFIIKGLLLPLVLYVCPSLQYCLSSPPFLLHLFSPFLYWYRCFFLDIDVVYLPVFNSRAANAKLNIVRLRRSDIGIKFAFEWMRIYTNIFFPRKMVHCTVT